MTEEYRNTLKNSYVFLAKFLGSLSAKNPNTKRNLISFIKAMSSLKPEHAILNDWFENWFIKRGSRSARSILNFNLIEQAESFDYEMTKISLAYVRAMPLKKRREIFLRVSRLMKDFGFSVEWLSPVINYLMFRWVSLHNLPIKRNVSRKSFKALMEYENFFWIHYFPNTDDRLKNYQNISDYGYQIAKTVVQKGANKSKDELITQIKNKYKSTKISGYGRKKAKDFLNNIPSIKDRLNDFDVIEKLYPNFNKKQIKQKVGQMKKIRERIKHIKILQ